ncbi:MAG: O-antigen ligase family protein [bacterium]
MKRPVWTADNVLTWCLYGYALAMPVSIAVSEPLAFLALPVWLYLLLLGRAKPAGPSPYFWPVFLFTAAAVLSASLGLRPELSMRKLDRLLLLGVVFIIPAAFCQGKEGGWKTAWTLVTLFVAGATLKAAYDTIRIPLTMLFAQLGGLAALDENGMPVLFKLGNMREPQIYAVSLCFIIGALLHGRWTRRNPWAMAALVLNAMGLILHFKRGAWLAFVLAACVIALAARRRNVMLIIGMCAIALFAFPQVRHRVGQIENEFSQGMGGRLKLWTQTGPRLIRQYPFGIGWRAVKYEDLRGATRHVQRGLNHLHDNPLQIALETGWLGLAAWLNWMGVAFYVMWTTCRRAAGAEPEAAAIALGVLGGFSAVMLNGVVEYNFGDAEIFMILCFLLALSALVNHRLSRPADPGSA